MSSVIRPKIIRSRRKTVALQILPDATLVIKAPFFMPMLFINKFLEQHSEWIEKKVKIMSTRSVKLPGDINDGHMILYLGKQLQLQIGTYSAIQATNTQIFFPRAAHFRIKKELSTWYIRQAREIITQQVEYYAKQMEAEYTGLTFSDTKSQWGRCTRDNKLQFSWRLIMAPLLVINYVVVHELAHTFEKNHSRSFWNKVRLHNPSYRQQIKWLKEHGHELTRGI